LVVAYIILVQGDRSIQAKANQRQQFINQSIQLGRVNEALIRALAAAANKDEKLRDLLAQNGITINSTTGAPAVSGGSAEKEAAPTSPTPAGGAIGMAPDQERIGQSAGCGHPSSWSSWGCSC